MRTFPRELAEFRKIVRQRGDDLRRLDQPELLRAGERPVECLTIGAKAKQATIAIIVKPHDDGRIQVVIQGFMKAWIGQNVALDGFYRNQDGSNDPMPDADFYEFD
jgi:hypothetical protein